MSSMASAPAKQARKKQVKAASNLSKLQLSSTSISADDINQLESEIAKIRLEDQSQSQQTTFPTEDCVKLSLTQLNAAKTALSKNESFMMPLDHTTTASDLLHAVEELGFDPTKLLQLFRDTPKFISNLITNYVTGLKMAHSTDKSQDKFAIASACTQNSYLRHATNVTPLKWNEKTVSNNAYVCLRLDLNYDSIIQNSDPSVKENFVKSLRNEIGYNVLRVDDAKLVKIGKFKKGSIICMVSIGLGALFAASAIVAVGVKLRKWRRNRKSARARALARAPNVPPIGELAVLADAEEEGKSVLEQKEEERLRTWSVKSAPADAGVHAASRVQNSARGGDSRARAFSVDYESDTSEMSVNYDESFEMSLDLGDEVVVNANFKNRLKRGENEKVWELGKIVGNYRDHFGVECYATKKEVWIPKNDMENVRLFEPGMDILESGRFLKRGLTKSEEDKHLQLSFKDTGNFLMFKAARDRMSRNGPAVSF